MRELPPYAVLQLLVDRQNAILMAVSEVVAAVAFIMSLIGAEEYVDTFLEKAAEPMRGFDVILEAVTAMHERGAGQ